MSWSQGHLGTSVSGVLKFSLFSLSCDSAKCLMSSASSFHVSYFIFLRTDYNGSAHLFSHIIAAYGLASWHPPLAQTCGGGKVHVVQHIDALAQGCDQDSLARTRQWVGQNSGRVASPRQLSLTSFCAGRRRHRWTEGRKTETSSSLASLFKEGDTHNQ